MSFPMDVFISFACISAIISISHFFRGFARKVWSKESLRRLLVLEFLGAFELTAAAYECSIVLGTGGITTYALFVFCIWFWRTRNWHEISASPGIFIESWVLRKLGFRSLILVVLAQLAGGLTSYPYCTALYWNIGIINAHSSRLHEGFTECTSSIQTLPLVATCAEAFGIFVYIVVTKLIARVKYLDDVAGLLNALIGTALVLWAFEISGGYFNPVLASSMQFGCSGSTLLEHFLVYWMANAFGILAAHYFDTFLLFSFRKAQKAILGKST